MLHISVCKWFIKLIFLSQNEVVMPFRKFNISEIASTISKFTLQSETKSENSFSSQFLNEKKKSLSNTSKNVIQTFNSDDLRNYFANNNGEENGESSKAPLLLMFTAQFCGFCGVALAQFVRLGEFLKSSGFQIKLGKVNTYTNSLPPELSPEKIPTFVYFPTRR